LKREVKKLELEVNKLKKQAKLQSPQDNRSNMVKKLEKKKTAPKIAELVGCYLLTFRMHLYKRTELSM
jgi:hypothetical protein